MMNRFIHALVAFFVVAIAMAQNAASPPVSNRGHNLREVATPPLQVGDVVTRLARTADGDFAVVFSSVSRRTTLYRSVNGGAYKALLNDSNATFSGISQSFSALNTDGSVGANGWEFGSGQIAFSTLCKTTLLGLQVTARCMTWTYQVDTPEPVTDKVIGIGDSKGFTRANNQPVQATVTFNGPFSMAPNGDITSYLSYSTPDPRNSGSTFNYEGVFRASTSKLTELLTPSLATVYGSWERPFGVLFQEGPGNTIASQLVKYDPKTQKRTFVLQTGATFEGLLVRDILVFARPDEEALYVRSNDPNLMARLFSYDGTKLNELFRSSSSVEGIGQREFNYPTMNNGRGLISLLSGNEFDAIALIRGAADASLVVKNGDVINGKAVGKVRGNNLQTTAFNGCTGLILTNNPDGTARMLSVEDPCINTTVQKDGIVTMTGENLVQPGLTTQVLANDGKLIDAKVSASSISFSLDQLAFGDNSLRVIVGDAKSGVVNIHVDPPPAPEILSLTCEPGLVASGDPYKCSWTTINGKTSVTVNGQPVDASQGFTTGNAYNTVNIKVTVTGVDGTSVFQVISVRVQPKFTSDIACATSTDDVSSLTCAFSAVGATPQSAIALTFVPSPTDDNPEPQEIEIGILNITFLDEVFENGQFNFQPDPTVAGVYIVRLQSPGSGIGGNQFLSSDPMTIVIPSVEPPPDGTTKQLKHIGSRRANK